MCSVCYKWIVRWQNKVIPRSLYTGFYLPVVSPPCSLDLPAQFFLICPGNVFRIGCPFGPTCGFSLNWVGICQVTVSMDMWQDVMLQLKVLNVLTYMAYAQSCVNHWRFIFMSWVVSPPPLMYTPFRNSQHACDCCTPEQNLHKLSQEVCMVE